MIALKNNKDWKTMNLYKEIIIKRPKQLKKMSQPNLFKSKEGKKINW